MVGSREDMKYIVVTGGVLSGLGKGITASSIGRLLKERGMKVSAVKIDPYLNCDAGTMNPYQHGEVYVLDDGAEADLDLGNYERFLNINLGKDNNITTGKVYRHVIELERKGEFLGETVQIIPHITNEIKRRIKEEGYKARCDVLIIELGGTVGDIESMPFLEAVRQLHTESGHDSCIFVHTTLVPVMSVVGEQKTKPTQHSVKELRSIGIQPDIIVARANKVLPSDIKGKIAMFCDVPTRAVVSCPNAKSIYEVPLILEEQGVADYILERMGIHGKPAPELKAWKRYVNNILESKRELNIAIVGKYTKLKDSYLSHIEALAHCSAQLKVRINIVWVESDSLLKKNKVKKLEKVDGIIIPGGFGGRGKKGKIRAITFARENKVPLLGVCLGFQLSVIEFCRNVMGLEGADSAEFDSECSDPVINLLPGQKDLKEMGGNMRLGSHDIFISKGTKAHATYGLDEIKERHRHRYEVNPKYHERIENAGLKFSGKDELGERMEIAELEDHPFFVASQFHPEFKSRPMKPSPLHLALVKAAMKSKGK